MTAPRTVVVWYPDWPITAAGISPDVPAAVVRSGRIVACSAAARYEGVVRNLPRREAQVRCPEVVLLDHDPARDARAFEPMMAALETVCPRIEIVRPGIVAFLGRGPQRYFGGDEQVAGVTLAAAASVNPLTLTRIDPDHPGARQAPPKPPTDTTDTNETNETTTSRTPLPPPCRVGIADGRFAATLAARTAGERGERVHIVPRGETPAFLANFPVWSLERPELADLFVRLGIRTLGDLARLPKRAVLARFGVEGELAARLARGEEERPLAARRPPDDLVFSIELDPPADRADRAAFAAKTLADQLHRELGKRGLACTRIAIEAETEHGEHLVRLWRHDGTLTAGAIAERVRWQLDGWLTDPDGRGRPTSGVTLVRLAPDEVRRDADRQLGFWGGGTQNDERAARALARVQGMLGLGAVCTPVVTGGRSPTDRVRLVPWGDSRDVDRSANGRRNSSGSSNSNSSRSLNSNSSDDNHDPDAPPWPGQVPAPAPTIVYPEPIPAEVVDRQGVPVRVSGRGLTSARPARLIVDGEGIDIVAWAGPWPVDERWWDTKAHRRRARFQLLTAEGSAHLAAVEGGHWWIEATYD